MGLNDYKGQIVHVCVFMITASACALCPDNDRGQASTGTQDNYNIVSYLIRCTSLTSELLWF